MQWSVDHTRVVLSSAISSPTPLCTPPMIEAARLAVQEGYEGTMHRYCLTAHDDGVLLCFMLLVVQETLT